MTIHLDMALEKLHLWTFAMQQKIQGAQLKISCFMVPVVTAVLDLKVKKMSHMFNSSIDLQHGNDYCCSQIFIVT